MGWFCFPTCLILRTFSVTLHNNKTEMEYMKKILLLATIIITSFAVVRSENKTLFPYPNAPESLTSMEERCSYVVERFWDRCNIDQAFSSRIRLQQAFNDYGQLIPYASAESVHKSIEKLIERLGKKPDHLLSFAQMAEGYFYSDTAHIVCDEAYYPFAKAVAENKKIKSAEKARFAAQARILSGSQVNMVAPDFTYVAPDGSKHKLSELPSGYVILFFNNPDCADCMMARVRLAADYNIDQFIKRGQLNVVSIYPGDPEDEEWKSVAERLPENWVKGASADVDLIYDMRDAPVIYYLNNKHVIMSKSMTASQLIDAFREINTRKN